jgi:hypothetical protein
MKGGNLQGGEFPGANVQGQRRTSAYAGCWAPGLVARRDGFERPAASSVFW